MPAKVTSKISWRDEKQKKRARRIAEKAAGDLSSHIQQFYDSLPDPKK